MMADGPLPGSSFLNDSRRIMWVVVVALMPGTIACIGYYGWTLLINVIVGIVGCVLFEALITTLRGRPVSPVIADGSAVVTGLLLALCLPPELSPWIVLTGCFFAIVIAKQLYGGLGHNLFNPAMVGYAVLILSFPLALSLWPAPADHLPVASSSDTVLATDASSGVDALTGATPLDSLRQRGALTLEEFYNTGDTRERMSRWQMINLAFLAGGLLLIGLRLARWRAPLAMLLSLMVASALGYAGGGSDSAGSPFFHLFSGATMLGAFFIVTDPVTSPDTRTGQWLFGAGVGLLTLMIRTIGAYPDGIAFAVLLMNACAPLIDHLVLRVRS